MYKCFKRMLLITLKWQSKKKERHAKITQINRMECPYYKKNYLLK